VRLERGLLALKLMQPTLREYRSRARGTEPPAVITTIARRGTDLWKAAFWSSAIAGPPLVGMAAARWFGTRRAGLVAGGLTALALGALRWQLQRLFNGEPDYEVERRIGRLEVRHLAPRVEARTTVDADTFDRGLELGFERLFRYITGDNRTREHLAMTSPVTATHRDGFTVGFVMPPERTRDMLPVPEDEAILLCETPERRVAVLRFRGRYDAHTVSAQEDELLRLVAEAGLTPVGPITFAGYDPPTTLPLLRRIELSVELAP
jgi:hypothetical protein